MSRRVHHLVLLRHGESEWNQRNISTGWVDVDLTRQGRRQASAAGGLLAARGTLPDVVHTSLLRRAIHTAHLALDRADRLWIPVRRSWRLNERHYGALQGREKQSSAEEFGEEQLRLWRRSFRIAPPALAHGEVADRPGSAGCFGVPNELIPRAESLADVVRRLLPHWYDAVVPDLLQGRTTLVVAHGNSIRAMVKHLDQIDDDAIADVDVPTGIPLYYRLGPDLAPIEPGGEYLDPDAAAAGIAQVRSAGRRTR